MTAGWCQPLCTATTNDQVLFKQLNLVGRALKMLFDCPPDDVQVDEGDGSCHAVAYIRTRIFQKSLRITWNTSVEFVAREHIEHFYMAQFGGSWWIVLGTVIRGCLDCYWSSHTERTQWRRLPSYQCHSAAQPQPP